MTQEPSFAVQTSSSTAGSRLDPQRIKYVTENFQGLQGLRAVALGVCLASLDISRLYASRWRLLGLVISVAALVAFLIYVPRYYTWRFGWVRPRRQPLPFDITGRGVAAYVILVFVLWVAADVLKHVFHTQASFLMLMQWLGLLCLLLFFTPIRRFRSPVWRAVAAVVMAVMAFFALLPLWFALSASQLALWKLLNAGSLGILLVVVGLCDHIKLTGLLPKRVQEDTP
jgi:hypothetical protein